MCAMTHEFDIVTWDLHDLLRNPHHEFVLIVLNHSLNWTPLLSKLWKHAAIRIAADGGANRVYDLIHQCSRSPVARLDVIIGDLDSVSPQVKDYFKQEGNTRIVYDPDQYSTDFGKAVQYASHISRLDSPRDTRKRCQEDCSKEDNPGHIRPRDIIVLGGLEGRVDQAVSQLHHLYACSSPQTRLFLLSSASITFLLRPGRHEICFWPCHEADSVPRGGQPLFESHAGILPLQGPSAITTKGFKWDVDKWMSVVGGRLSTSNQIPVDQYSVEVETSASVLFTRALDHETERR